MADDDRTFDVVLYGLAPEPEISDVEQDHLIIDVPVVLIEVGMHGDAAGGVDGLHLAAALSSAFMLIGAFAMVPYLRVDESANR
jgi:hypothetical protein